MGLVLSQMGMPSSLAQSDREAFGKPHGLDCVSSDLNAVVNSLGYRSSVKTSPRLRSMILSTYPIITGQAASQAPQVVQDQSTSSSMTLPTISVLLSWSRRSTVNCWGDSGLSVAQAGQARSQRPHSVQVCRSSICFQLKSLLFITPNDSSSSKSMRFKLLPRLEKNTFGIEVNIWKCLLRGRRIKKNRIDEVCSQ